MNFKFDDQFLLTDIGNRPHEDLPQNAMYDEAISSPGKLKVTMFDIIKEMNADELADFFFGSPEIEFGVCAYCENFGGAGSPEPCLKINCYVEDKNKAFKKYLRKEVSNGVSIHDIIGRS